MVCSKPTGDQLLKAVEQSTLNASSLQSQVHQLREKHNAAPLQQDAEIFHQLVVASSVVVCWGSSLSVRDSSRIIKLVRQITEQTALRHGQSMIALQKTFQRKWSLFSDRLAQLRCYKECNNKRIFCHLLLHNSTNHTDAKDKHNYLIQTAQMLIYFM